MCQNFHPLACQVGKYRAALKEVEGGEADRVLLILREKIVRCQCLMKEVDLMWADLEQLADETAVLTGRARSKPDRSARPEASDADGSTTINKGDSTLSAPYSIPFECETPLWHTSRLLRLLQTHSSRECPFPPFFSDQDATGASRLILVRIMNSMAVLYRSKLLDHPTLDHHDRPSPLSLVHHFSSNNLILSAARMSAIWASNTVFAPFQADTLLMHQKLPPVKAGIGPALNDLLVEEQRHLTQEIVTTLLLPLARKYALSS